MAISGDFVKVFIDSQELSVGDITSVDLGLTNDQYDVSGFGSDVHKMINGMVQAPVTIKGFLTTDPTSGTHTLLQGAFASGSPVNLEVQIGQNAVPGVGDPKYSGDFYVASYVPAIATGGAVTFTATLNPATDTAPSWDTV